MKKVLSIITPYYNTLKYTQKLAEGLVPQLTDEVEWIIVDDGTNDHELDSIKAKVIHLEENSGNASRPRNVGIDNAEGDFITFIDSDDEVTPNYVSSILEKIKSEDFDYCYFGWKTSFADFMIEDEPLEWNRCVWNCIYKKTTIGDTRFCENYNIGEDDEFNKSVRHGNKSNILDILYFYNWKIRDDCISSLYEKGKIGHTKET